MAAINRKQCAATISALTGPTENPQDRFGRPRPRCWREQSLGWRTRLKMRLGCSVPSMVQTKESACDLIQVLNKKRQLVSQPCQVCNECTTNRHHFRCGCCGFDYSRELGETDNGNRSLSKRRTSIPRATSSIASRAGLAIGLRAVLSRFSIFVFEAWAYCVSKPLLSEKHGRCGW